MGPAECALVSCVSNKAIDAIAKAAKTAYRLQRKCLEKHKARVWAPGAPTSCCLKHPGQQCRVAWTRPDGVDDRDKPKSASFSTPMCTPWTAQGAQKGEADDAMESFHLWMSRMSASNHDVIWFEKPIFIPMFGRANLPVGGR